LISTITLGGKASWSPAARLLFKTGQSQDAETLAPLADDLTWRAEPRGNNVIRQSLAGQQHDLGADDLPER
jgi:hypothetical protein